MSMSRFKCLCLNLAASSKKHFPEYLCQQVEQQKQHSQFTTFQRFKWFSTTNSSKQESEDNDLLYHQQNSRKHIEPGTKPVTRNFKSHHPAADTRKLHNQSQNFKVKDEYKASKETNPKTKYTFNKSNFVDYNTRESAYGDKVNQKPSTPINKKQLKDEDAFGTLKSYEPVDFSESYASEVGSHNERYKDDEAEDEEVDRPHLRLSRINRRNTPYWYSKKIINYGNKGQIKEAIIVLDKWMLTNDRVLPTSHNFSVLLGYLGKVGYTEKAFKIYNKMKELKIPVKPSVYTSLFNACANSPWPHDGLRRATKLLQQMRNKDIQPNLTVYKALMKAFGMCGDLRTAFAMMDEAAQRFQLDAEIFSHLLMACISDKEAGFQHAIKVWGMMRQYRIKPDVYLYNLFLRSVRDCRIGDETFIKELLQPVTEQFQDQTVENSNYLEIGQHEDQLKYDYHSGDVKKCITGNVATSSRLWEDNSSEVTQHSAEVIPRQDKAVQVYESPNILDSSPSSSTHIIGIKSIKTMEDRLALIGGVDRVLLQMKSDDVTPDIRTFTQLMDIMPSTLSSERHLLAEMKKNNVTPDIDMLNLLIRKRSLRRDDENAKLVLKIIDDYQLNPNIRTFGCLAMTCRGSDDGLQLLKDIEKFGMEASAAIFGILTKASGVNFRYKLILIREMRSRMIKPTPRILENIEAAISRARRFIIDKEQGKEMTSKVSDSFIESFQQFIGFYEKWLKDTEMERPIHPWETFRDPKEHEAVPASG